MAAAIKLHRHVGRRRAARFLAEGPNLVEAALRRNLVVEVFVTEAASSRFESMLSGVPVHLVTDRAAKALSDTVTPAGLVAVCEVPSTSLDDVLADRPRLIAVAVEISEPGNAGTLIRIADAMGADAVVLAGNSVDPYNGKCLRASAGSIFTVPVVSEADAGGRFQHFPTRACVCLPPPSTARPVGRSPMLSAPTAWLFGPESHGLPTELADAAAERVRIPMSGGAESLNVAAAAAICLYQSARVSRRQ